MMGTWTKTLGFPLLELLDVTKSASGALTCKVKQGWFLSDGSTVAIQDEKTWPIPVFAVCSGGKTDTTESAASKLTMVMVESNTQTITLQGDGDWIKLNAGQYVPMRVKYPDAMVPTLAAAVRAKQLSAFDRMGLLADQAALAKAGKLSPLRYLELLAAFGKEDDAIVCEMLIEKLAELQKLLASAPELQVRPEPSLTLLDPP